MVKKGRLSNQEKYAIQGMLHNGMNVEAICEELDRSERSINKYIDGELDHIASHITKAKLQAEEVKAEKEKKSRRRYTDIDEEELQKVHEDAPSPEVDNRGLSDREVDKVVGNLVKAGLTERDAERIVDVALAVCEDNGIELRNTDHLFSECVKRMRAGHFIQKRTESGTEGVAIMSSAASQRLDEAKKFSRKSTRKTRGNIFNPSTGEIE